MSENQEKSWWKSKTVISGLLTATIGVLVTIGVLTPESASAENIDALSNNWIDIATSISIVITGLIAVYGRITAQTTLKK